MYSIYFSIDWLINLHATIFFADLIVQQEYCILLVLRYQLLLFPCFQSIKYLQKLF